MFARRQGLGRGACAGQHRLHRAQRVRYVRLFVKAARSRAIARLLQDLQANLDWQIAGQGRHHFALAREKFLRLALAGRSVHQGVAHPVHQTDEKVHQGEGGRSRDHEGQGEARITIGARGETGRLAPDRLDLAREALGAQSLQQALGHGRLGLVLGGCHQPGQEVSRLLAWVGAEKGNQFPASFGVIFHGQQVPQHDGHAAGIRARQVDKSLGEATAVCCGRAAVGSANGLGRKGIVACLGDHLAHGQLKQHAPLVRGKGSARSVFLYGSSCGGALMQRYPRVEHYRHQQGPAGWASQPAKRFGHQPSAPPITLAQGRGQHEEGVFVEAIFPRRQRGMEVSLLRKRALFVGRNAGHQLVGADGRHGQAPY